MHNKSAGRPGAPAPYSPHPPSPPPPPHLRSLRRRTDFIQFESYQIHTHTRLAHTSWSQDFRPASFVCSKAIIKFRVKLKDIIQMAVTFYLRF